MKMVHLTSHTAVYLPSSSVTLLLRPYRITLRGKHITNWMFEIHKGNNDTSIQKSSGGHTTLECW